MYGIHHPIHHYKRLVGCVYGTCTTDTYGSSRSRLSGSGQEIRSRHTALEGIVDRQHRSALYIRHLHSRDRTRQVFLCHLSITDHYHLIQRCRLFLFHSDIECHPGSYRQCDCLESEELELQCIRWSYPDREFPVSVSDHTASASRYDYCSPGHRYPVCIQDSTCHRPGRLLGSSLPRICNRQHQYGQMCQHQSQCSCHKIIHFRIF